MSPENYTPVCLLCLKSVDIIQGKLPLSQEEGRVVNYLLKRFVHFTKTFLGVQNADRTLNINCKEIEDAGPLKYPVFCDNCEIKVIEMLEMYTEFKALECKLLGKVMIVGDVMETSSSPLKDKGFPIKPLSGIAKQLETDTHYLLVELFRIRVTEKCKAKSKRMLPKLELSRCPTSQDIKMLPKNQSSAKEKPDVRSLSVSIAILYLYKGWNLDVLPEIKHTGSEYFKIVASRSDLRIPTRETLSVYCSCIVLCAIALGWELEEILKSYPSNNTLPQRIPFSEIKQIRRWNKRRVCIKTEISDDELQENENNSEASAYSPCPSIPSYDDSDYEEPSRKRWKTKAHRKFQKNNRKSESSIKWKMDRKSKSTVCSIRKSKNLKYTNTKTKELSAKSRCKKRGNSWNFSAGFKIKCKDCEFTFLKMLSYEDHLRNCHSTESSLDSLKCESCSQEYSSYSTLMLHLEQVHQREEKRLVCVYCADAFSTFQLYSLHRRHNHWIQPQELPCDEDDCEYAFFSPKDLRTHMESHLTCDIPSSHQSIYTCDKCNLPFFNNQRLQIHALVHTASGSNSYTCPKCPLNALSLEEITSHFNNQHINKEESVNLLTCKVGDKPCKLYFFNNKNLKAHEEIHQNYEKSVRKLVRHKANIIYSCMYCNQEFLVPLERSAHEESCASGPSAEVQAKAKSKFVCPICMNRMSSRDILSVHMRRHYPPTFECDSCNLKFRRKSSLRQHMETMHFKKRLVCPICGWTSTYPHKLKFHIIQKHERANFCKICGKSFPKPWLLIDHNRVHSGERLQCEWCDAYYPSMRSLKYHMKKFHEEKWKINYGTMIAPRINFRLINPQDGDCEDKGLLDRHKKVSQYGEIAILLDS